MTAEYNKTMRVIFFLSLIIITIGREPIVTKTQFSELLSNLLKNIPHDQNFTFQNTREMKQFLISLYDNEYNSNCKCGKRNLFPRNIKRIVAGYEAHPNEFPWQAQILYYDQDRGKYVHTCGGTLISSKWVLTAEHCFRHPISDQKRNATSYQVILGEHNRKLVEGYEKWFNITKVISHPSYQSSAKTIIYDFTLGELNEKVVFTKAFSPACLPSNDNDQFVNEKVIASGWGRVFQDGPIPEVLNFAELKVLNNSECGSNVEIDHYHLCASGSNKYGDLSDTCEGDSGGPLVANINGRWTLIGVVSYGINCSEPSYPGVYARVSSVLDWIYHETKLDACDYTAIWTEWLAWSSYTKQGAGGERIRIRGCDGESHSCMGDSIETDFYQIENQEYFHSKLMVVGGAGAHNDVEIIDLLSTNRTCRKPANCPVKLYSTGSFFQGHVTVCGGLLQINSCYVYESNIDEWIPMPDALNVTMIGKRNSPASCLLDGDKWWISGGSGMGESTSEYFQMGQNSFTQYVDLPETMSRHTMVQFNDTIVIFVGNNFPSKRVYEFNAETEQFKRLPDFRIARRGPVAGLVVYNNGHKKLVVAGGLNADWNALSSSEELNLESLQWSSGPDLPLPIAFGESVPFRNSFLIVGGSHGYKFSEAIFGYNAESNGWLRMPQQLKKRRSSFAAFLIPDHVAECN